MPRRARPPRYDTTIPEGWTVHDGSGLPPTLPREACPAVMQRNGARLGENLPATPTIGFGALPHERRWGWEWGRLWTWDAAAPNGQDIVAYLDDGTRRAIPVPPVARDRAAG